MKKITIELEFYKGQIIYENLPDGQIGMVIGWLFGDDMELLYEVRWLNGEKEFCIGAFLSETKVYG